MAITVLAARRRIRRVGLGDCLPERRFEQLLSEAGIKWRQRLLTPAVVLRLFVLQVLHGNIAINALRQLSSTAFTAAAFCKARQRLPLWTFSQLLRELVSGCVSENKRDGRIFVVDGSSVSLADTPPLRKRFGLPSNQLPGVGHPQASILGLMDLATGLLVRMVVRSVFTHDLRGAVRVHAALQEGDILLADRAFAGFAHVALLAERGVDCLFRLSACYKAADGRTRLRKRGKAAVPPWLDPRLYRKLRSFVRVRVLSYRIEQAGYRSKAVRLVTTLLDKRRWSDQRLRELYARRWEIETAFAHAKTTLRMSTPRCKTADGVMKELAVYLIVYNLIRLQMLKWASAPGVDLRRVSFIDTMRYLAVRAMGLPGVDGPLLNPARPGRRQLRVLRRRLKHYPLLTKPRAHSDINHDPRRR